MVEIGKSKGEVVRVERGSYFDRPLIDVRVFAKCSDGRFVATRKGLSVAPEVAAAVAQAIVSELNGTSPTQQDGLPVPSRRAAPPPPPPRRPARPVPTPKVETGGAVEPLDPLV